MSRQYKFHNKEGLYFVSFAVVYWIDLFVREIYNAVLVDSLNLRWRTRPRVCHDENSHDEKSLNVTISQNNYIMSRQYKFHNKEGLYFVSFAVVYWIDLFVREIYNAVLVDSLNHHIEHKGMKVYGWVIMSSHVHLIFTDTEKHPDKLLGGFKSYTSRMLQKEIAVNPQESRKEWLLWMFRRAGEKASNVTNGMLWQHHNKPIELWSGPVIEQKLNYIHQNPVKAGYVEEAAHWRYSSAVDYAGGKGLVKTTLLW